MPLLRARQAMREMSAGDLLEIHLDDPAALKDLQRFAELAGHRVVSTAANEAQPGVYCVQLLLGFSR